MNQESRLFVGLMINKHSCVHLCVHVHRNGFRISLSYRKFFLIQSHAQVTACSV